MPAVASQVITKIGADITGLQQGLKQAESETKRSGGGMKSILADVIGTAGGMLAAMGIQASISGVINLFGGWIKGAEDAKAQQAQLNAVLLSTHNAVGMTADQINLMVQRLQNLDGIDKTTIMSGENMLLTFTNIGSKVFPEASQAMLDMAVKMNNGSLEGLNLKDTAIQLGKALDDPVKGLTALSRVGVTFTEEQKKQIQAMVKAGDIAGAQGIILKELEREFGGSAAAAGNVDPFNKFKLALDDVGKTIGGYLLPPLTSLMGFITPLAQQFGDNLGPAMTKVGDWVSANLVPPLQRLAQLAQKDLAPGLDAVRKTIALLTGPFSQLAQISIDWRPVWQELSRLVNDGAKAFNLLANDLQRVVFGVVTGKGPFGELKSIVASIGTDFTNAAKALAPLGDTAQKAFDLLTKGGAGSFKQMQTDWLPIIKQVAQWFQSQMVPAIMQVIPPATRLIDVLVTKGIPAFFAVRDAVSHVVAVIASTLLPIFETVEPIVLKVGGFLMDLAGKALAQLLPKVQDAAGAVRQFADDMHTRLQPFIDNVTKAIQIGADIIGKVWGTLWPWISGLLQLAWDDIKGIIKIGWDFISGLFKIFADILSGNWGQMWADIKGMLGNIWNDLKGMVGNLWNDIKHLFDVFSGIVGGVWNNLWSGFTDIVGNVWNGILGIIQDGVNGAIDLINGLIDAADKMPGVNIGHLSHVNFTGGGGPESTGGGPGNVHNRGFASGGITPSGGLFWVGENGPELMALPGGTQIYNNAQSRGMAGSGEQHIHLHSQFVNEQELWRAANNALKTRRMLYAR